jgi:glycosyltransferase involved in cell wall biosynthesis
VARLSRGPVSVASARPGTARCAVLIPAFVGGGAQRIGLTLAGALADAVDVDLVAARPVGELRASVPANVRVVDLNASRMATAVPSLVQYLRYERPAGMVSMLTHTNIAAIVAAHLARTRTSVVVTEHLPPLRRNLGERMGTRLIRPLYERAEIVAVSAGVRRDLSDATGIPAGRIHVIYNPVDVQSVRERAAEPAADLAPPDVPMLLSVGRLTDQKDHVTLVRAFALVRRQRRCTLVILGEGEGRAAVEAEARRLGVADDVTLPGFIPNPYPHFRRAAAFVLSSRWEGLPTALIEALLLGVPAVSTDCEAGPREILADGRYGALVPVGDARGLAAAILSTLTRPPPPLPPSATARYRPGPVAARYAALLGLPAPAAAE